MNKKKKLQSFEELMKELDNNKNLERSIKGTITAWCVEAYQCGVREAGEIIGKGISKAVGELSINDAKRRKRE